MTNNIPMNQRERKQRAIKVIIACCLAAAVFLGLLLTGLLRKGYEAVFLTPTPTPDPRAAVAEAGVSAFLNFEYNGDYDAWLKNICSISTDITCMAIEHTYGPQMLDSSELTKTDTSVTNVKAIKMVSENYSEVSGHQQIWAVSYTITNWSGTLDTYEYVMITEVDGEWKFDFAVMTSKQALDEAYGPMLTPQGTTQP
jgi:hypothetical protein